ncbi:NAD(P)H-dependent glycerol-3-phosphate dehydrogenase [Vannielia litorea]|uniref:NAD(P)H-dependent glycerol-3-phosphate dehydrogenase n=1 Tax=Vannielia litorea TaxID=1217970 RepID=UPI001C95019D|nr:NAD(P)H-dependent glycerol-3-phosphate dehydrogenase [Vannielia litorea]MBY6049343.1 NAD(P)-dependent glycerol-3-phosphate dehydrogenase [Vannielia litorea]MBY6076757.1 NAD(P)-dependent glycerol-3-phosphate dehydrogenase [Vannielia litorea]
MSDISVIGAGAFGTALASQLAGHDGPTVTLWARDAEHAAQMNESRENARYLPGVTLPPELAVVNDNGAFAAPIIIMATPMQTLAGLLESHRQHIGEACVVAACKGVDLERGKGPTGIIEGAAKKAIPAILTGPSFAVDIARGLPTALTLACADKQTGEMLQSALSTTTLRLYLSTDPIGAELGGALKNVIAIACGACMGAGFGESARAALMTRGYAEMARLASALGGKKETLAGLSGFGDLALTCTSDKSRNFRHGFMLGRGETPEPGVTTEGIATAEATLRIAKRRKLDMPITEAVAALTDGTLSAGEAMALLLSRPLTKE